MIQSKPAHCNNESIEVLNWLSTEILSLLKIDVEILKWSWDNVDTKLSISVNSNKIN